MELKVEVLPSVDVLIKKFQGAESLLITKLKEGVLGYAYLVERGAKVFAPVDTGRMRGSIGVSYGLGSGGLSAMIGPHVDYAYFVHQGTRHMKGRPFMEWGLNAYRREGDKLILQKVNEALKMLETKV